MTRNILEAIRDRLVQRSLIGKRKLDRTATRRALDDALRDLGERYRAMVRAGKLDVPDELGWAAEKVKGLEAKLEEQDREIEKLEKERPSTT